MADRPLEQYWASIQDPSQFLDQLDKRIKIYYDDLDAVGLMSLWERSFRAYYGGSVSGSSYSSALFESSKLKPGGKAGEKTRLKANHFRNLIRHLHQLVTQQKPDAQARASNSDYRSQAQTILGNGLLDYYWREKHVSQIVRDAAELGLIYGQAFVHAPWDPNAGETYAVSPDGQPVYEGDQAYDLYSPLDVVRDPSMRDSKNLKWGAIRSQENRWDLIERYASMTEEILKADAVDPEDDEMPNFRLRGGDTPKNDDIVNLWTFYHDKTESLPQGRMVICLRNAVLFDGPLPYRKIPIHAFEPEQLFDTIYGYSLAFDLLGLQEGIDELHTTLMSNNKTFGIQSLWIKDTDKIQVSSLTGGMKLFKSEEPPTPIQLTKSAPESYNYLDKLEQSAELLSGISSTVRGKPEASLKSGNALALVVSQSIQFANGLEDAVNRLVEELGMSLINNLRDFSQTKRVANIIGRSQRAFAKEFTAQDLDQVNRVVVEQVNPLSKTIAGRAEIANNLLQQGLITDPQQYMMVLSTGQLDPVTEGPQAEMLTIRAENEELREGVPVVAVLTENHALHIREHKSVIASPEAKQSPELVMAVLAHIQEHIDLARSMDPALAMILGQQPLPPALPGMPGMVPQATPAPTAVAAEGPGVNMPGVPPGAPPEAQEALAQLPTPMGVGE